MYAAVLVWVELIGGNNTNLAELLRCASTVGHLRMCLSCAPNGNECSAKHAKWTRGEFFIPRTELHIRYEKLSSMQPAWLGCIQVAYYLIQVEIFFIVFWAKKSAHIIYQKLETKCCNSIYFFSIVTKRMIFNIVYTTIIGDPINKKCCINFLN